SKPKSGTPLILVILFVMAVVPTALLAMPVRTGNHSLQPQSSHNTIFPNVFTGRTQLGIDCGLGSTIAQPNATGVPLAPSENNPGAAALQGRCTWSGDVSGVSPGDGTNEPLVTDQDESLSLIGPGVGGGFTAAVFVIQNSSSTVNGFDLQLTWNPAILRAVEFDQTNEPTWAPNILLTAVRTIDNTNGVAELAQVISGTANGNLTLFRMRFSVVGVGVTNLNIVNISNGLANPGPVVHDTLNGSFDSDKFFDPTQTLRWQANMTLPSPPVPGSPNIFKVQSSCQGCTGPFTFTWQFNSTNTSPFIVQATGNPVTVTIPNTSFSGNRVTAKIADSATPTSNIVTITMTIPLTVAIQGPTTATVGSSSTWTGIWLSGQPQYSGTWRLCPGTQTNKAVCSNPAPLVSLTQQTSSPISVTYNYGGVYNNTLTLTDSSSVSSKTFQLVNVTGAPLAYTVAVSANPTSPLNGTSTAFSATITYNPLYPAGSTFRSTLFTYLWNFGDGSTAATPTTTTTATMNHAYALPGTYVMKVTAQEASSGTPSHIQEVGIFTVIVIAPLAGIITPSTSSAQ
ncbi:MAG TPA: PKD domain-containing protein, partial [Candidatus Bathyarchaeia archaeon]|nr:PKD domain-containing protein [Candidatus Bathyarchaeia archaeon]